MDLELLHDKCFSRIVFLLHQHSTCTYLDFVLFSRIDPGGRSLIFHATSLKRSGLEFVNICQIEPFPFFSIRILPSALGPRSSCVAALAMQMDYHYCVSSRLACYDR